ncbi:hypothetical protein COOONC_17205 [Cooperia oncophora]
MATSFDRILEILEEWPTYRIDKMGEQKLRRLLTKVKDQIASGGKIITAWFPEIFQNGVNSKGSGVLSTTLCSRLTTEVKYLLQLALKLLKANCILKQVRLKPVDSSLAQAYQRAHSKRLGKKLWEAMIPALPTQDIRNRAGACSAEAALAKEKT